MLTRQMSYGPPVAPTTASSATAEAGFAIVLSAPVVSMQLLDGFLYALVGSGWTDWADRHHLYGAGMATAEVAASLLAVVLVLVTGFRNAGKRRGGPIFGVAIGLTSAALLTAVWGLLYAIGTALHGN
jgi:hypothetical protein